jgi:hypothetical protein
MVCVCGLRDESPERPRHAATASGNVMKSSNFRSEVT